METINAIIFNVVNFFTNSVYIYVTEKLSEQDPSVPNAALRLGG